MIDKYAKLGDENRFEFAKPNMPGYNYSFSGLKTSFLYFLRDELKKDADFIEKNKEDLCASLQKTIVDILMDKLRLAAKDYNINEIAVAGGVSANSGLRDSFVVHAAEYGWTIHIPKFEYTTDNAAMVAITGYYKFLENDFCDKSVVPYARASI